MWIIDAVRGTRTRIRSEALAPEWTPDGRRIAMNNSGNGLVLMTPDGGEPETLATVEESRKWIVAGSAPYPSGWTLDGRYLLLQAANANVWRFIRRRSSNRC